MKTAVLALIGPVLAACASAVPEDKGWFEDLEAEHVDTRDWFPAADTILEGFDPAPDVELPFLTGDRILYGVSIARPEERKTWLVLMEVVDSFDGMMSGTLTRRVEGVEVGKDHYASLAIVLRVTLFDEEGNELGENETRVPGEFLKWGFHEVSHDWYDARRLGEDRTATEARLEGEDQEGLLAFIAFTNLISENDLLSPILWEAMPALNLFGVLFNLGVHVDAGPSLSAAVPYRDAVTEPWGEGAFRLPLRFGINGDSVLYCSAVVVPPVSPVHVGAGIVSVVGRRPGNDPMRCRLQVLACRRKSDGR